MVNAVALFDARASAWVDPKTGRLTREAQIFIRELWLRGGGGEGVDVSEIEDRVNDVSQVAFAAQLGTFNRREQSSSEDFNSAESIQRFNVFAQRAQPSFDDDAQAMLKSMAFSSKPGPAPRPDSDQFILASIIFGN